MNVRLREILSQIKEKIIINPNVVGIVAYGSIGRNEEDELSDIDVIIYTDNESPSVIEDVLNLVLSSINNIYYWFHYRENKFVILTRENIWIEVLIHSTKYISQDVIYIVESRIMDPSQAIIYDRYGIISNLLNKHWFSPADRSYLKQKVDELVDHLIYYLRLFVHYRKRKDKFRAYMNYTIAMYKIAGLLATMVGEVYNLYGPWFLFEKTITNSKIEKLYFKTATMFDESLYSIKNNLLELLNIILNYAKQNNPLLYEKIYNSKDILIKILDY